MKRKNIELEKMSVYLLCLYIISIFTFTYDVKLMRVSDLIFLFFFAITVLSTVQRNAVKYNRIFLAFFGLLFLALSSSFWAIESSLTIARSYSLFQLIVLMILVYNSVTKLVFAQLCIKSIAIGGLLMAFYALYFYGIQGFLYSIQHGLRLGGEINQANAFGYYSTIAFVIIFYYGLFNRKVKYYLLSIIPVFFVIASGSRRGLILVFISIIVLLFLDRVFYKNEIAIFAYLAPLLLLGQRLYSYMLNNPIFARFNSLLTYFTKGDSIDTSILTRQNMISFGKDLFLERPLIGYGADQYRVMYNMSYGEYRPAHNQYIQILVDLGIVGFFLYYIVFFYIVIKLWFMVKANNSHFSILLLTILIIHLLSDFTSSSLYDKFTYIFLALSLAFLSFGNESVD